MLIKLCILVLLNIVNNNSIVLIVSHQISLFLSCSLLFLSCSHFVFFSLNYYFDSFIFFLHLQMSTVALWQLKVTTLVLFLIIEDMVRKKLLNPTTFNNINDFENNFFEIFCFIAYKKNPGIKL